MSNKTYQLELRDYEMIAVKNFAKREVVRVKEQLNEAILADLEKSEANAKELKLYNVSVKLEALQAYERLLEKCEYSMRHPHEED